MQYVTEKYLMKILQLSRQSMYRLRTIHNLKYSKVGGKIYYHINDIDDLMNRNSSHFIKTTNTNDGNKKTK